jgi:hypothetical protein
MNFGCSEENLYARNKTCKVRKKTVKDILRAAWRPGRPPARVPQGPRRCRAHPTNRPPLMEGLPLNKRYISIVSARPDSADQSDDQSGVERRSYHHLPAPPRIDHRHSPCSGRVPSQWRWALRQMLRSGLFGPAVCRLLSAESGPQSCSGRLMTPAAGSRAPDKAGPRCPSITLHVYQRRLSAGSKAQRHDGAVVGPLRSAVRGPACCSAAHGPARGAARVSPKKPSRRGPSIVLSLWKGQSIVIMMSQHVFKLHWDWQEA